MHPLVRLVILFIFISLICSIRAPVSGGQASTGLGLVPLLNIQEEPGCLVGYKSVTWYPAPYDPGYTFEICLRGPSYPNGNEYGACKYIGYTGGELLWYGLIPGSYAVAEVNPENLWAVTQPANPISVIPGMDCARADVINVYNRGFLMIRKEVDWGDVSPEEEKKFWICVQGPSFPSGSEPGACQAAEYRGGNLEWKVLPGEYTVRELDPGHEWEAIVPPGPVSVSRGETIRGLTVTNRRRPPGFQLLTPTGYEVLAAGQPWLIRWVTIGTIPNVRLEYSTDNFIYGIIIASSTPNTGYYLWTLPPDPKENLRVRVIDPGGSGQSDTSDQPFRSVIMNERNYLIEISR